MIRYPSLLLLLLLSLTQCSQHAAAWNTGRTDALSDNQIMLVMKNPESLGWKRLRYAAALHPELDFFLENIGIPDCIAETTHDDRHYMILYQLKEKRAFSCRSIVDRPTTPIQVSGPHPISAKEYATLNGLKKRAQQEISLGR